MELDLPRVRGAHGEGGRSRKFRYIKGSKKMSVKNPEEWRSDGRGCTLVSIVNGNGMRELFVKNEKKKQQPGQGPKNLSRKQPRW